MLPVNHITTAITTSNNNNTNANPTTTTMTLQRHQMLPLQRKVWSLQWCSFFSDLYFSELSFSDLCFPFCYCLFSCSLLYFSDLSCSFIFLNVSDLYLSDTSDFKTQEIQRSCSASKLIYTRIYVHCYYIFRSCSCRSIYIYSVIVIAYKLYLQHLILSRYDKAISTKVTTAYGFVYRQHSYWNCCALFKIYVSIQ